MEVSEPAVAGAESDASDETPQTPLVEKSEEEEDSVLKGYKTKGMDPKLLKLMRLLTEDDTIETELTATTAAADTTATY